MTDLETAAIKAALNVFENSAAFLLPIPNTNPPLYLACGEAGDIAALLESNRSYSFAANEAETGSNISERIDSLPMEGPSV